MAHRRREEEEEEDQEEEEEDQEEDQEEEDQEKVVAKVVKSLVREACEENGYKLPGRWKKDIASAFAKQKQHFSRRSRRCGKDDDDDKNEDDNGDALLRLVVHEAKEYARPPTSNFHVGAACCTNRGNVFVGVNVEVEKCALHRSIHAEQCMIMNAKFHMDGGLEKRDDDDKENQKEKEKIVKIAITHAPCGHCRQFINELRDARDILILLPGMDATPFGALLPYAFGPLDLEVPGDEEHRKERIKRRKSEASDAIILGEKDEKVRVRTLLLDGCPPNPRDRDGLGTMEKFYKVVRKAVKDGRIDENHHHGVDHSAIIIEKLAHTMAHSYAPYTDSPCAIAIPVRCDESEVGRVHWHFASSVECAAYNPSMTLTHAMQVALHCSSSRPQSYRISSEKYNPASHETRPILWNTSFSGDVDVFVFSFRDAKISYTETLEKEIKDIAKHYRDGKEIVPSVRVNEILFDRHGFDDDEDNETAIITEFNRVLKRFFMSDNVFISTTVEAGREPREPQPNILAGDYVKKKR